MVSQGTRLTFILVDIFCFTKRFAAALLETGSEGYDGRRGWPDVDGLIVML